MAVQKISIHDFMLAAPTALIIDSRSPGEFEHAHIVSARNLPLFSNEERAAIGTTYKKQSREAAIKLGLPLFGKKLLPMIECVENWMTELQNNNPQNAKPPIFVHCWRGGMRSAAVAWLLDLYGYKVFQLVGGYKAYRNWVLDQFIQPYRLKIIGGYTGSGKTEILQTLSLRGHGTINLEGLADHKGSAFGALGQAKQCAPEMFENKLATALYDGSKLHKSFWVEDESQRIGMVIIPAPFFKQMRESVCHFLVIPFEERLQFIIKGYGQFEIEDLKEATIRIQKRLGGLETKKALQFLNENNIKDAFAILLHYYDKWYEKNAISVSQPKFEILHIASQKVDALENALLLEKI